jgi:hypothetical protein
VHIDPDHFKSVMTEWPGYMERAMKDDSIKPGTLCHMESCLMQEIAQEIALENSQNIWVDGSLKDGEWFKKVFADVRQRYGAYRIAIFNVAANEVSVRSRAKARELKTGRGIPEAELVESLKAPDSTLRILMPFVDFVARIDNSDRSDADVCLSPASFLMHAPSSSSSSSFSSSPARAVFPCWQSRQAARSIQPAKRTLLIRLLCVLL